MIILLITSNDVLDVLGKRVKQARKNLKYTQDYVSENIGISTDLLRSIENGRNIGSITTLLNLCNFLKVSPNYIFRDLLDFAEETTDFKLEKMIKSLSIADKETLEQIIIYINKNY